MRGRPPTVIPEQLGSETITGIAEGRTVAGYVGGAVYVGLIRRHVSLIRQCP